MSRKKDIVCKREDCFAYYKGVCSVLRDTHFKKKECPFFKPKSGEKKE